MLEDVGDDAGLRKNVEAEIMILPAEAVDIHVLVRVVLLRRRNVLILEDLAWLVVVLFNLVRDLDPANAQAYVRPNERDGLVNPPDYAYDVVVVLADDVCVVLHLGVHRGERGLLLLDQMLVTGETDKTTAPGIVVIGGIIEISEVELHGKRHGQLDLLDVIDHLQLVVTLPHGFLGLRYVLVEDLNDVVDGRLRIQLLENGFHGLDKQINIIFLRRCFDQCGLMRCRILLPHAIARLIRRFTISAGINTATTIDAMQSAQLGILIDELRDMWQDHLTQLVLIVELVANLVPEPAS